MTAKEKILSILININYAYNDCSMYSTIKDLLDEMEEDIRIKMIDEIQAYNDKSSYIYNFIEKMRERYEK